VSPPEIATILTLVGVPVASALIAIGVWLGKRDDREKAGGPTVVHTESTTTVPAPAPPLPTLSGLDADALRGRLGGLEMRVAEQGTRITTLEAERDMHEAARKHELELAMNKKLTEMVGDLASALRDKKEARSGRIDPRRE
jgi:hypothetical protein